MLRLWKFIDHTVGQTIYPKTENSSARVFSEETAYSNDKYFKWSC